MDECKPLVAGPPARSHRPPLAAIGLLYDEVWCCHISLTSTGGSVPVHTRAMCTYLLGRAVQVDPIKTTLKAPGIKLLKLKYDKPLSNFAFKFNLRRYTSGSSGAGERRSQR